MCLDSGLGISDSLAAVAERMTVCPALAEELRIVRSQAEVSTLDQALADFASRVDLPDARMFAALLTRSDKLGNQVGQSLLSQSDQLRTQRRQRATLRANKTPVKLVLPLVFCFAPAALILLVAPAVLDLKEFLSPSAGQPRILLNGEDGIVPTLDRMDQRIDFDRPSASRR